MDTKQMEVEQIFRISTADELQKIANAWELPEVIGKINKVEKC